MVEAIPLAARTTTNPFTRVIHSRVHFSCDQAPTDSRLATLSSITHDRSAAQISIMNASALLMEVSRRYPAARFVLQLDLELFQVASGCAISVVPLPRAWRRVPRVDRMTALQVAGHGEHLPLVVHIYCLSSSRLQLCNHLSPDAKKSAVCLPHCFTGIIPCLIITATPESK